MYHSLHVQLLEFFSSLCADRRPTFALKRLPFFRLHVRICEEAGSVVFVAALWESEQGLLPVHLLVADTAQLDRDRLQLNLLYRLAHLLLFLACMFGGGGLYCNLITLLLQFLYRIVSDVLVALSATWAVLVPVASVNMPEEAFGVAAVSTTLENVQVLASVHALEANSAHDLGRFSLLFLFLVHLSINLYL